MTPESRIIATFQPQIDEGDHVADASHSMGIDVTRAVLSLDLDALHQLVDESEAAEKIVPLHMIRHNPPFVIRVEASLLDFFNAPELQDVTEVQLEHARRAHGIETHQVYEVTLQHRQVRETKVRIQAGSPEEARAKAMQGARATDFHHDGHTEYEATGVDLESQLRHPRPRG